MQTTDSQEHNTNSEQTQKAVISRRALTKGQKSIQKKNNTLSKVKIVYMQCSDLKPNSYNPNRQSEHDFELLLRSIEEDGFTTPIIINENNVIVDGEHRWRAATTLGMTEVPVVKVNMTNEQMRISTIRHNRARGSHDMELEVQVLRELQQLGALEWAQDSLMIGDDEINKLLEDVAVPEALSSEEYSQAWTPQNFMTGDQVQKGEATTVVDENTVQSVSPAAFNALREREKKVAAAHTEEERVMAAKVKDLYRLILMFEGEEAALVREAVGDSPAVAILEMCKTKLGK